MGFRRAKPLLLLGLGMSLFGAGAVHAGLGGDSASIIADSHELKGTLQAYSSLQYDVQEITTENGIRVKEFLNRNGLVFAIAWSGPAEPDLQQLLGVYFAQYRRARMAQTPPGVHRELRLAQPELVVESGGHMRAFRGRAYLPTHLPPGVLTAEVK